jgi:hypothetical protein
MSIEACEKRLAEATPGPWHTDEAASELLAYKVTAASGEVIVGPGGWPDTGGVWNKPDAVFIVHAPTDLALLLAVVRAVLPEHYCVEGFNTDGDEREGCACGDPDCCVLAALDAFEAAP